MERVGIRGEAGGEGGAAADLPPGRQRGGGLPVGDGAVAAAEVGEVFEDEGLVGGAGFVEFYAEAGGVGDDQAGAVLLDLGGEVGGVAEAELFGWGVAAFHPGEVGDGGGEV